MDSAGLFSRRENFSIGFLWNQEIPPMGTREMPVLFGGVINSEPGIN